MAEIKNKAIVAVLAAIAVAFADAAATDAQKKSLTDASDKLAVLDAQLDADKVESDARIDQLTTEFDEANEVIAELKIQLTNKVNEKADDSKKPVVDVDGEKYEVNFTPHGYADRAAFIANDAALKDILKIDGQTCLTKI